MIYRIALCAAALLAAVVPLLPDDRAVDAPPPEWPTQFEGRALEPMAATMLDDRLARGFPGHIARFTDGRRQVVLRSLSGATRQLHPASDCFEAIGYRLRPLPMVRDGDGALSSCFKATRDGISLKVCERVLGQGGESYPDVSSWYWPALLGQSTGPWLATMTVERVG